MREELLFLSFFLLLPFSRFIFYLDSSTTSSCDQNAKHCGRKEKGTYIQIDRQTRRKDKKREDGEESGTGKEISRGKGRGRRNEGGD